MECEFQSAQDDLINQISNTSRSLINEDGLNLIGETIQAVKTAINKINYLKYYFKQRSENDNFERSDFCLNNIPKVSEKTDETIINAMPVSLLHSKTPKFTDYDIKKQIYFSILDNRITETEIKEVFEKEGFQDFVVTLKNKYSHSYGFIKFTNEDSVKKAVELHLKISVGGQLMKIRPHKNTNISSNGSLNHIEDTQEIDECLPNNVVSGYQNHMPLTHFYESQKSSLDQNEKELVATNDPIVSSTKAEIMEKNKIPDKEQTKENKNECRNAQFIQQLNEYNSACNSKKSIGGVDYDPNMYTEPLTINVNFSSKNNKGKMFASKKSVKKNSKKIKKNFQQNLGIIKANNRNNQKTDKNKNGNYFDHRNNFHH